MIEMFISYLRSAVITKGRAMATVAGYDFYVDPKDLRNAAVNELRQHAAAWVVIAREGALPWAIPLLPGVLIDDVFFTVDGSFLLSEDLTNCQVKVGDYAMTISQGNGYVFHGKTGYLLRRTKEGADELCKAGRGSYW